MQNTSVSAWLGDNYKIISRIHANDQVTVSQACDKANKSLFYLKTFKTSNESRYNTLQRGIELSQSLSRATKALPIIGKFNDKSENHLAYALPQGISLEQLLNERKGFEEQDVLKLAHTVTATLAYAKKHFGAFHGDLKPSNIIEYDQQFRLSDWEIGALLAQSGELALRAHSYNDLLYLPPERIAIAEGVSTQVDFFKADVYSLGLILLRMLGVSKQRLKELRDCPFEYYNIVKLKIIAETCENLVKIGHELSELLHELLRFSPADRPDIEQIEASILEIASDNMIILSDNQQPSYDDDEEEKNCCHWISQRTQ